MRILLSVPRLLALVFCATAALSVRAQSDDLSRQLAQRPAESLTAEEATQRIQTLRALEEKNPGRTDEIEAYLIPFVRATMPPPAEPTPTPTPPPPPAARPMLLLVQPDGTASTMKAASFRKQGAVIMVVTANGSRAVLQAITMVGQLPWYAEEELAGGAVNLNAMAASYESFARAIPGLRTTLGREAARLRKMQQARAAAAAEQENAARARLAAATGPVYKPSAGYTAAALAKILLTAEKVRSEMPENAAKIDAWAAPFHEHFTKLLSGQAFLNGAWVSTEELAREAREKRQAEFLQGLDYQIGREPFPAGAMRGQLLVPVVEAALAVAAGAALMFYGRRRKALLIPGAALLAIVPLALAAVFFLATRNPALLPPEMAMADDEPVVEALSEAAGLAEDSVPQEISEGALNSFVARHVQLADSSGAGGSDIRQALAVRLLPGRIAIFEMIRSLGLSWIVRLDLEFQTSNGKPGLALAGAKIGQLDCSKKFAAALWGNLQPQFAAILAASQLDGQFVVQRPKEGSVELQPVAKSEPAKP